MDGEAWATRLSLSFRSGWESGIRLSGIVSTSKARFQNCDIGTRLHFQV